jgi:hypothetical protein
MSQSSQSGQSVAVRNTAAETAPQLPGNLGFLISRIEEAVDEETAAIRTDINFDIKASNVRKSRFLYELTRALKNTGDPAPPIEHRSALERLRDKLAINESAIRAHLNAVNEIATLMQNAIRHAETDGTYSAGEFGWAK